MRVLYFTRGYTAHDHRFLTALSGTDHEVYYLRLEKENIQRELRDLPKKIKMIEWLGGKEPFAYRHSIRLMKDLERVINLYRPDVVHAGPIQTCAFLAAQSGFSPLVSMSWGSDLLMEADSDEHMTWVTQYALDRTQVLLGDCQAVADKAQTFGFPADRICLFPWGVDLSLFTPGKNQDIREKLGWQNNPVLLSLRAWEPIYGVDVLLKGFALAVRKHPELRLLLLGDGSLRKEIQAIINEFGLASRVHMPGQVQNHDLIPYYQTADLYLSSSFSDGSSVSLMEALASGLPALVSDIPGNLEWIIPGEQGWLFTTGLSESLADGITTAMKNRDNWPQMRLAARKTAEQRADWQKNFQKLLGAYDQAIQLKSSYRNSL